MSSRPTLLDQPLSSAGRLSRLRQLLYEAGADALLVTEPANVRYLTGFSGSAGMVLVTGGDAVLFTDGRYRTQAAEQLDAASVAGDFELVVGGAPTQRDELARRAGAVGRLGLEADSVTWGAKRRWGESLSGVKLVATSGVVEQMRRVKDAGELARMAHAASLADAALAEIRPLVAPGRREDELSLALDSAMRRLGAEDRAFETIVASGPNAAKPHARPTARQLEAGDAVVVDFGAVYDGYRSDMTRTFFVSGHSPRPLPAVYALVAEAQAAGVAAVAAGVVSGEVDRACREAIAAAGFGDAFEHGTGHGVGLYVHEAPSVSAGATAILESGTVVTVEPGVYLAGVGGVRIEDTVVVTDDGCQPLTTFPKDPAPVEDSSS